MQLDIGRDFCYRSTSLPTLSAGSATSFLVIFPVSTLAFVGFFSDSPALAVGIVSFDVSVSVGAVVGSSWSVSQMTGLSCPGAVFRLTTSCC